MKYVYGEDFNVQEYMQLVINSRWVNLLSDYMKFESWKDFHSFCDQKIEKNEKNEENQKNEENILENSKNEALFISKKFEELQPGLNTQLSYYKSVRDLELIDYLERIVSTTLGVQNVMSFFNFCFDDQFNHNLL